MYTDSDVRQAYVTPNWTLEVAVLNEIIWSKMLTMATTSHRIRDGDISNFVVTTEPADGLGRLGAGQTQRRPNSGLIYVYR